MKKRDDFWIPWLIGWAIAIAFVLLVNTLQYFFCDSPDCDHRFLVTKGASQSFVLMTAIAYIIFHFIDYVAANKAGNRSVRMKFSHFKDVYYINPGRWYVSDGLLIYKNGESYFHQERYCVTFTYLDWLKLLLWKKLRKYEETLELKRKKKEAGNKRMAEMLKYIQKDIDEAYEKISGEKGGQK